MPGLRYVVLHHTGIDKPHYDLMLELSPGSELSTWRLPHWPPLPGDVFTPLAKHRRDYLEYEGQVSNGRGRVKRVNAGSCVIVEKSSNKLTVVLNDVGQLLLPVLAG
jgi:hypothetical protein